MHLLSSSSTFFVPLLPTTININNENSCLEGGNSDPGSQNRLYPPPLPLRTLSFHRMNTPALAIPSSTRIERDETIQHAMPSYWIRQARHAQASNQHTERGKKKKTQKNTGEKKKRNKAKAKKQKHYIDSINRWNQKSEEKDVSIVQYVLYSEHEEKNGKKLLVLTYSYS